ncbi:MAG: hypothetical protein ACTTI3_02985 [Treponema sp.]
MLDTKMLIVEGCNLKGFHANYKDVCEKFIKNELRLIISEDHDYLGRGMYFWDHKSNARYWKVHKKSARESAIVSAEINLEQLLDLTDDDICAELDKSCARLQAIEVVKPFGKKLDYIFEAFKLTYTVIKGRENKERKAENPF